MARPVVHCVRCITVFVLIPALLPFLGVGCGAVREGTIPTTVTVRSATAIARTDENFVCATLDWWPPEKCNYEQCPWGNSSIINLDLNNPILRNAVQEFKTLRIRLGGSLQDQVVYKLGGRENDCPQFQRDDNGMFSFTEGCLDMNRWDELNAFLEESGALVTFGLNALSGRHKETADGLYAGNWDPTNAADFIEYTLSKGYNIDSWEFGNELCGGGVSARVDAVQYAQDVLELKHLVDSLYSETSLPHPKLLAPGGFFNHEWFAKFLDITGPNVVDGVTHHIYNLGAGDDPTLIDKIQDPFYLSKVAQTYRDMETTIHNFGPWASAWVGESGGAYNSGGRTVSHTFANSFWYLDQLGMTSTFNHKVFCRQALIGGNYALLNTTSFVPNPDYYGALLWHRLMDTRVLQATQNDSPFLRTYAHCSRQHPGSVTVMIINLSNSTSFDVNVVDDFNIYPPVEGKPGKGLKTMASYREEYHLTPKDGNIQSDVLLLNEVPLQLTGDDGTGIPGMWPVTVNAFQPIYVAKQSIVFATLIGFPAAACM